MDERFNFSAFILFLIKRWKFIIINAVIGMTAAVIYTFFFAEKQYASSITFLPPFEERSLLSMIPGNTLGSFNSSDIVPQQINSIFFSKSLRMHIIERFNYYEKYELVDSPNKFERALVRLNKDLLIDIEELGSLGMTKPLTFTITSYHTSADTCYNIIRFTYTLLDSMIREIGIDKGSRSRMFIEAQLQKNKNILDTLQENFKNFQIQHKAFNVPNQLQLTLSSYGQLKAQVLANEIKINTLKNEYNDNYPLLVNLREENAVLNTKLKAIENMQQPDVAIGLFKSAELLPTYTNFIRDIEVQNKLIVLLTQQLEEAKLKESRDVSSLKIIDQAFRPEYKARPRRLLLCAAIFSVFFIFLLIIMFGYHFFYSYVTKTPLYYEISNYLKKQK